MSSMILCSCSFALIGLSSSNSSLVFRTNFPRLFCACEISSTSSGSSSPSVGLRASKSSHCVCAYMIYVYQSVVTYTIYTSYTSFFLAAAFSLRSSCFLMALRTFSSKSVRSKGFLSVQRPLESSRSSWRLLSAEEGLTVASVSVSELEDDERYSGRSSGLQEGRGTLL